MERLEYDLLFRWFVGLGVDDAVWDPTVFSKNRDRLLDGDIAAKFLAAVLARQGVKRLLSDDHFSVDGTLIEAWASMKSFTPQGPERMDEPPRAAGGARNARSVISTARSARTRRTPRRPIPTRGFTARAQARRRSCASWAMR